MSTMTNCEGQPTYLVTRRIRRGTAKVFRVEVFKVRLPHSNRNCDSHTGIVDDRQYGLVTLATDDILHSAFVHSSHIPISIPREVFNGVVGNAIGPQRFVEIILRFLVTLPFLVPPEAGTAAATSDDRLNKCNASVNPRECYLQIFVWIFFTRRCQVVSTE